MSEENSKEPREHRTGALNLSRRSFLTTAGTAGVVAALDAPDLMAQQPSADPPETRGRAGAVPVALRINGRNHRLRIDPRTTLLDCLRETIALTGTKKGCDHVRFKGARRSVEEPHPDARFEPRNRATDSRRCCSHRPHGAGGIQPAESSAS